MEGVTPSRTGLFFHPGNTLPDLPIGVSLIDSRSNQVDSCGGLNENTLYRFLCLKTWLGVDETIWDQEV